MLNPVITRRVPRIDAGKIWWLYPASSQVAVSKDAVTIGPRNPVPTPGSDRSVPIAQPRLCPLKKLVRQLEVEVVADALRE